MLYLDRTPFGLHLHALRNAPRRLDALGFDTVALRVAAFAFSGAIAWAGGVLNTWYLDKYHRAASTSPRP